MVACVWVAFNWSCSEGYEAWYEFYPSNPSNCFGVSPGDYVGASSYYTSGQYELALADFANNQACSESSAMSMGSPAYGQFIAENPASVLGHYLTPSFHNFTFDQLQVGGWSNILKIQHGGEANAYDMTLGPVLYNQGACTFGASCFVITHT